MTNKKPNAPSKDNTPPNKLGICLTPEEYGKFTRLTTVLGINKRYLSIILTNYAIHLKILDNYAGAYKKELERNKEYKKLDKQVSSLVSDQKNQEIRKKRDLIALNELQKISEQLCSTIDAKKEELAQRKFSVRSGRGTTLAREIAELNEELLCIQILTDYLNLVVGDSQEPEDTNQQNSSQKSPPTHEITIDLTDEQERKLLDSYQLEKITVETVELIIKESLNAFYSSIFASVV